MSKNLVIVESPAKAKTIEKYLGKDFTVLSSVGHIRGIVKKTKDGTPPIDTKNGYTTVYEVDPEKKKIATELKKAVKGANDVWLATDEDREGEAIAWHLCEVLKLDPTKTKRIVFHEITKPAIEEAVKNPRTVDMNLVQAQQARQILDRLVGFELSPVVWQKVPGGKSAGRVQSPAVRLLVEREREIDAFSGSFSFKITATFTIPEAAAGQPTDLKAELPQRFDTENEAQAFLEKLLDATFTVSNITTSPSTRNPGPPFTTSSLQQEANSRLGFGAKATMASAQKLYQEGKITYMRTDSVNLSGQALAQMTEYIKGEFGDQYHQYRTFKTKSASAQEAHEAIRPTDVRTVKGSGNEYDQKLYDLIRRRTLASQMAPAKLEKTTVTITIGTASEIFEAKGEVIIFDGFLKVYGAKGGNAEDTILPPVASGDRLLLGTANARQVFSRPPARYTEGSLVKKLEELGIGRPSTYATIINTVQVRGYAVKGESEGTPRDVITLSTIKPDDDSGATHITESNGITRAIVQEKTGSDRGKLVPTAAGMVVSDFLTNHFDQIVDYGFTANVEEEFDDIACGKLQRNAMLDEFYHPFHKLIQDSGGIDRSTVAQAREIGTDPKSGKPVLARFGRFGPMLQLGNPDKDDKDPANKPQFAPMPTGTRIETVTLEQALEMFKLPREVGTTPEGEIIKANIGRFGPYIVVGKTFVGIKPLDPHTITGAEARELYAEKLKKDAEKFIQSFDDGAIQVLNGRYGPYITNGKKNAKIPKDKDPKKLTRIECMDLLAATPEKPKRGNFHRRTAK